MSAHAGIRSRIDEASGVLVHEGYCSCGHVTEAYPSQTRAIADLVAHHRACPHEAEAVDVTEETQRWVDDHYPDETCTLDEWRARYG